MIAAIVWPNCLCSGFVPLHVNNPEMCTACVSQSLTVVCELFARAVDNNRH